MPYATTQGSGTRPGGARGGSTGQRTVHCALRESYLPMSALPGPAPAPTAADVLDAEALARLRELDPSGKGGLVARVLATYTQSLAKLLEQFNAARAQNDLQGLRYVAHTLKSSSASVGALQLSARCADIERSVREQQTEGLGPQLDAMAQEAARVLAALRTAA